MLIAQTTNTFEVPLGWRKDTTGALQRLNENCSNGVTTLRHESGESFNIICGNLNDIADQRAVAFAVWGDSLCACSAVRSAVIAALARDDQSSFGMSGLDVSESRQLHCGVDRFGPR